MKSVEGRKARAHNFRCSCGRGFVDKPLMIDHYRKDHPGWAPQLWDAVGTTGDEYADLLVKDFEKHLADARELLEFRQRDINRLLRVETEYRQLRNEYNDLLTTIHMIKRLLPTVSYVNVEPKVKEGPGYGSPAVS